MIYNLCWVTDGKSSQPMGTGQETKSHKRERVDAVVSKEDEDEGKSREAQKRKSTKCGKG